MRMPSRSVQVRAQLGQVSYEKLHRNKRSTSWSFLLLVKLTSLYSRLEGFKEEGGGR